MLNLSIKSVQILQSTNYIFIDFIKGLTTSLHIHFLLNKLDNNKVLYAILRILCLNLFCIYLPNVIYDNYYYYLVNYSILINILWFIPIYCVNFILHLLFYNDLVNFYSKLQMKSLDQPDLQMQSLDQPDLQMQSLDQPDLQMQSLDQPDLQMQSLDQPDLHKH